MEIISDLKEHRGNDEISLAIGVFDGVHRGHCEVINHAVTFALERGYVPAVMTFRDKPKRYSPVWNLTSFEHKIRLIERLGCRRMYVIESDEDWFYSMNASLFIEEILKKKLCSVRVSVGEDFRFGLDRSSHIRDAAALFEQNSIELDTVPLVMQGADVISSSLIKKHLKENSFDVVANLLGRRYSIGGKIKRGTGLGGQKLGIRTANIDVSEELILLDGVYAVRVTFGKEEKLYTGVMSVGTNPTVAKDEEKKMEVHIFDFDDDIYGKFIEVFPVQKIRDTQKFNTLEALRESIHQDIKKTSDIIDA